MGSRREAGRDCDWQGGIAPCTFVTLNTLSKDRDRAYRTGTSPNGVKVKNTQHPAVQRVKEKFRDRSSSFRKSFLTEARHRDTGRQPAPPMS
jgi:hypothetical protein